MSLPKGHYKHAEDLRLYESLRRTQGWNPVVKSGRTVRIRCGNCGTLLTIDQKDWEGEFEVPCPTCRQISVFGHRPFRWGTRHELQPLERMLLDIQSMKELGLR